MNKNLINKYIILLIRNLKFLFFLIILHLFYSKPANASQWNYVGIDNYSIGVIETSPVDSSIVFASGGFNSSWDLFKSIDNGNNWLSISQSSIGLPINPDVNSIAFDPINKDIVYISVFNKGVYKTSNGGSSWQKLNLLTNEYWEKYNYRIKAIEVDQKNSQVIYAGLGNNECYTGGIYKSIDGGITWQNKPSAGQCDILEITIDPDDSNIIYATGTKSYKSINKGENWLNIPIERVGDNAFVINPQNHNILYASQTHYLFGFFKSIDAGLSWQRIALENKRIHEIVINKEDQNTLFVSTKSPEFPGQGVYQSTDGGQTWKQINEGLPTLETAALELIYSYPKKLLLGTINYGLWDYFLETKPLSPIILLPGFTGSWNWEAIVNGAAGGSWGKPPIPDLFWPYDNLKNTLVNSQAGYVENKNYYEFYYDWRKKLNFLADDLKNFIDNTVLAGKPAETKVNLVGHSLGGLTARAYANKYGVAKIDKIVTVGSPHLGALKAYYAWSAGQPTDEPASSYDLLLSLLLQIQSFKYGTTKQVVHQQIPVIQDLLPIFNYLKINGVPKDVTLQVAQNDYLNTLNDSPELKAKLITLYGLENNPDQDTNEYYQVIPPSESEKLLGLWQDGKPVAKETTLLGDLTVLVKSATLSGVLRQIITGDHSQIIQSEEGIKTILQALDLAGLNPVINPLPNLIKPVLLFFLHSPANLKIIAPNGQEIGEGAVNLLPNAFFDQTNKMIVITQAQNGIYQTLLIGTGNGTYNLEVNQVSNNNSQWQTIKGKIATLQTINLNLEFDFNNLQPNSIKDISGDTNLNLAKERLQDLDLYLKDKITHQTTKKKLSYNLNKVITYINLGLKQVSKPDYYQASLASMSGLDLTYQTRLLVNQLQKNNTLDQEVSIYLKNDLEEVGKLLASAWISLYAKANKTITSSKATTYQKALNIILTSLNPLIEAKARQGENLALGMAYGLAQEKITLAQKLLTQQKISAGYINLVTARLLLLETVQLLK